MTGILVEGNLLDIGYGMPIHLSSVFGGTAPPHLVPASNPGSPLFRTAEEESPWVTIDLCSPRNVSRIRVYNSEGESDGALPLAVAISADGVTWSDAAVMHANFGGKLTGAPFTVAFKYFLTCRFIRVQARTRTSLRLHYVEVCAPLPHEYLGRLQNVRVTGTDVVADYWHHDSYGFSWTFTCTLGMILNARLLGVTIDRIDYHLCLLDFRDDLATDPYDALFETRPRQRSDFPPQHPAFERHGIYVSFPLDVLATYADAYFRPHARVRAYADQLAAAYALDLSNTVVLLYRGTDKTIEVAPAAPEDYAAVAQSLLAREPGLQVLCQTDQAQALDVMLRALPGAIWFRELPVTQGNLPIHRLDVTAEFSLSKSDLALRLLAMTYLVSRAKYVVAHTGNLAAWVALYRGRPDGLYQFCEDGKLRGPDGNVLTPDTAGLQA